MTWILNDKYNLYIVKQIRLLENLVLVLTMLKNICLKCIVPVTIQCNVEIPYFGRIRILIASLSNVKCSVMLWSDNRNIMDYWIFVARYCFKYDF